jgi:hypothetical protein
MGLIHQTQYSDQYSFCEHSTEPSASREGGEFLEKLSNYEFVKEGSTAWSLRSYDYSVQNNLALSHIQGYNAWNK